MKLKEAMKLAKRNGKRIKVTEPTDISEVKVNVSMRLDQEVLTWLKEEAEKQSIPYTTYANAILKRIMNNSESLEERVARLEKIVLKK